jgi:hypothetical protein
MVLRQAFEKRIFFLELALDDSYKHGVQATDHEGAQFAPNEPSEW